MEGRRETKRADRKGQKLRTKNKGDANCRG